MTATRARARRPRWVLWLLVALVAVPVVELLVIGQVAQRIGAWTVILLLLLAAVAGALVLARSGRAGLRRVRAPGAGDRTSAGAASARDLPDVVLTMTGGVLLLVPGFVTDVLALFCLVPPLRSLTRALLGRALGAVAHRALVRMGVPAGARVVPGSVVRPPRRARRPGASAASPDDVLEGRVLPPRRTDDV